MAKTYLNSRKRIIFDADGEGPDSYILQMRFFYRNCFGKLKSTWQSVCSIDIDYNYNQAGNHELLLQKHAHRRLRRRNRMDIYGRN